MKNKLLQILKESDYGYPGDGDNAKLCQMNKCDSICKECPFDSRESLTKAIEELEGLLK